MPLSHSSWVDKTGDLLDELRIGIGRAVAEMRVSGLPKCLRYIPYDPTVSRDLVLISSRFPHAVGADCRSLRFIHPIGDMAHLISVLGNDHESVDSEGIQ